MLSKTLITFLFLYIRTVSCKRSLTIILDTTLSMQNELSIIKRNVGSVISEIGTRSDIENYILLTFNDPEIGPPIYSPKSEHLISSINGVTLSGGEECPENSMSAIKRGLEISNPSSYIFVFTDAYAKDYGKVASVESLCESTQSKVVIFLNGYCDSSNSTQVGSVEAYYRVAKSCSGAFFQMDMSSIRSAFNIMKELTQEWTITSFESFDSYKEFQIDLGPFATDAILVVYGNYPEVRITNKQDLNVYYEKIHTYAHFTVIRLKTGEYEYKIFIRSQGTASATLYKKTNTQFQFGFSPVLPNSIRETSVMPLPVRSVNLIVPVVQNGLEVNSVQLIIYHKDEKRIFNLEKNFEGVLYTISTSFNYDDVFQISFTGTDTVSYKTVTSTTRMLKPQNQLGQTVWPKPSVEILADDIVTESGDKVKIPCKVIGQLKPDEVWEDSEGNKLTQEAFLIEIPSLHIVYVTVNNLTTNTTIYCKGTNYYGDSIMEDSIDLFVKRTNYIDEIQVPKDDSIEYGKEGRLFCQVNANPTPTIQWFRNGTQITNFDDRTTIEDDNMVLVIKSMALNDVGNYTCAVTTKFETRSYSANIEIYGLAAPEISVDTTEINAEIDGTASIECTVVKGTPAPNITWKFKPLGSDYFSDLPFDMTVNGTRLALYSLKGEHGGTYKCEAVNILGEDSREFTVHIKFSPIIKTSSTYQEALEGENVELQCDVSADPIASVHWEKIENDAAVALDDRHSVDEHNTLRFMALWKDTGKYKCIAENSVGVAEQIVEINVLVSPIINRPPYEKLTVHTGNSVTLNCDVIYGNPEPTTRWEFMAPDSTTTLLKRGRSTNDLRLSNVSRKDTGHYKCRADNDIGYDHITIQIAVV